MPADAPADEPEFASYEVGAGLGGPAPFLRATLADAPPAGAEGAAHGEPGVREEVMREVRVMDKLARLDAGLPPLPPGDYPDEVLLPAPKLSPAPAPRGRDAAPVAVMAPPEDEPVVEEDAEIVLKDDWDEPAWADDATGEEEQADEPAAPELFRPMTEARIDPPARPGPRLAATTVTAAPARRPLFRRFRG